MFGNVCCYQFAAPITFPIHTSRFRPYGRPIRYLFALALLLLAGRPVSAQTELPPATPLPTDLRLVPGTNSTLQWTSTGPASWFVEHSADFRTWTIPTNLGTLTPAGQTDSLGVTVTEPASQRFYRLSRPGQPVTITVQPPDRYARTNQYLFLGASRAGDLPIIDHWYRDGTQLVTLTGRPVDSTTLLVQEPGAYQLIMANPWGAVTSRVASVTFLDHLPARILSEPADETGFVGQFLFPPFEPPVPPGGDLYLPGVPPLPGPSAAVEGDSPITFRWYRDNALILTRTTSDPASHSYVYLTGPTNSLVSATYQLIASNAWGMATSRVATFIISQPPVTVAGGIFELEVLHSDRLFSGPARFRLKPAALNDTCVLENVVNASSGIGHYIYQGNTGRHGIIDAQFDYVDARMPPLRALLTYNSPTNGIFELHELTSHTYLFLSTGKFTFTP